MKRKLQTRIHPPRMVFITTEDFKEKVQIKCLKKKLIFSDLVRGFLEEWLNEK